MGRTIKRIWLFLLCVLLLTGCAKGAGTENEAENGASRPEGGDGGQGTTSLWLKESKVVPFEGAEEGYQENIRSLAALGSSVCLFRTEYPVNGGRERLCIQIYDCETGETEKNTVALEIPGREEAYIVSMELTAERELSLKLALPEEEDNYFLVKTDLQGKVLTVEEPFPENYPWNQDFQAGVRGFPLADGRVILCRWDDAAQASVLTWYDRAGGEEKPLGTLEGEYLMAVCCDGDGILYYYPAGGSIVRWDLEKNVREEQLALYREGIMIMGGEAGLVRNARGELVLCGLEYGQEQVKAYVMTGAEPVYEESIRLSCLEESAGTLYLQNMAAEYSRESGGIPVVMESVSEADYDDYRDRIFAELAKGEGPELLLLSRDDLRVLQDKNLLCDLTEVIPEEILEELIPGVAELGTVDGKMVGITPEIVFYTMLTANETWAEDRWNISEFTGLIKGKEDWECPVSYLSSGMDYYTLFWMVFCGDPEHTPFLDRDQGKCFFDSEAFIDILKICRKYGQPDTARRDTGEHIDMLKGGDSLARVCYIYNGLGDFSELMEKYGRDCHIVGFPSDRESSGYIGNYLSGYLAVNVNAAHREEVRDFIAFVLDFENQYETNGNTVRMDVLQNSVFYDEALQRYVRRMSGSSDTVVQMIALKPDGSSYIEEFLEFVENCVAEPGGSRKLFNIIGEELAACFEGHRSEEETAEIIQRRVQLYLDEEG